MVTLLLLRVSLNLCPNLYFAKLFNHTRSFFFIEKYGAPRGNIFFARVHLACFFWLINIWQSIMDRIENIGNAKKPFTASMHSTANL